MAARTIDQWLTALRGLDGGAPGACETLQGARCARRPRAGLASAAAAKLAGDHPHLELAEDLVDAFAWLCDDGAKRDPQAKGKLAVANALVAPRRPRRGARPRHVPGRRRDHGRGPRGRGDAEGPGAARRDRGLIA